MRPQTYSVWGERRISRFPCEVLPYVHGVCDRAGSRGTSRYRRLGWGLPLLLTASASRSEFTRLNTRPVLSPVNASTPPSRAAPHDSGPLWFGRVRWWRGSGLRMMPTFPPPPLSFRTVSFPQYGWKVGFSGSAFPHVTQVKPAPGMPCVSRRFASALRAFRCHTLRPALCRNSGLGVALPFEKISPLPLRSLLRSGFYCPGPSSLIRPHPPHSQAHSDFAAWRFIRNAFAVLVRLGDPRVVPCFCCTSPLGMPSSTTAGNPLAVCAQFLRQRHWPSPGLERLGTPKKPHHPLQMGRTFAASPVRYSLRPAKLLATLADLTGYFSQPTVAFTSRLSTGRSPFPSLDITTVATEQVPPAGLSPAGTSASIAAPSPSTYETFIHTTSPVLTGAQGELHMKKWYALAAVVLAAVGAKATTLFAAVSSTGRCPFCHH